MNKIPDTSFEAGGINQPHVTHKEGAHRLWWKQTYRGVRLVSTPIQATVFLPQRCAIALTACTPEQLDDVQVHEALNDFSAVVSDELHSCEIGSLEDG